MIALSPTRLRNGSAMSIAYQAVDTVVDPAFRGRGVFVKIASRAQEWAAREASVLWGFPNAQAAPGWYRKLGWTDFGAVPMLVRPLRSSFLLERVHPSLSGIDVGLVRKAPCAARIYTDPAELREDFDPLWKRIAARLGTVVERSGAWMSWRLLEKPGAGYRLAGSRSGSGELQAFLASKIVDKHSTRIAYVMEAIAAPEQTGKLAALLDHELWRAAGEGAQVALAWCPKSALQYRAYRKAGFLPLPARLRPIEINFGVRPLCQAASSMTAAAARWYVSYLDSDTN